jgi:transposase
MMGSPLAVTRDTHTAEDMRRIASNLKDARQVQRVQAISLVMEGWSRAKAAAFACVDRQTLRDWVERYNECGVDGLATLTSPGRPRLLTPNQAEALRQVVISGPDLGQDGVVRWRCVDLVKQSAVRFCVREVHPSTMAQWLRRLRLTKMTARPFHPKKDEAAQETFKANFKAIVEAELPDEVIQNGCPLEVWFQDEARVGQQGTLSRLWARLAKGSVRRSRMEWQGEGPIGSRPAMVRDNWWANASIDGAICPCRRVGAALVMATANTEAMNEHLKAISAQVAPGAHAVLVCDGAGWHAKSKDIVVPANVTLVTLPAYAPELNPMENVWEFLRDNRFGAQVWRSYKAAVAACCEAWNWFVSDAARIASIGARAWVIL